MPALLDNVLVFGRWLRASGMDVPVGRMLDVVEALPHVDIGNRAHVHHACRALLVGRRDDLSRFDRAFDAFWRLQVGVAADDASPLPSASPGDSDSEGDAESSAVALQAVGGAAEATDLDDSVAGLRTWSDARTLARKDFAEYTSDEIALARAAMQRLEWSPGERRTRRWGRGRGSRIDLRTALARSVRTGGDVVALPRLHRRRRERPVVLICDVSGSMERYSRMLLHFAHAMERRQRRVEVFVFATTLTRVTRELGARALEDAAARVSRAVPEWSGGTRIGHALRQFHQEWARRVLRDGAVVLLISDGWDRGEPALLRAQMARLQRSCHHLIWLNPLIGTKDYAPLTRGLQVALPFVDDFLPARTLGDMSDLALHLNTLSQRRRTHGHRRLLHV
ncbi:MAG TPA: VWA domain-containing protein [Luteitalea sp.]|nr:VWA domain-containing protein [Luteitalea sp.]